MPKPWHETSREYIENRENEIVNNKAQYCSVVKTEIKNTTMILGGEVDGGKADFLQYDLTYDNNSLGCETYRS